MAKFITFDDSLYDFFQSVAFRDDEVQKALRTETGELEMARMQISPEQGQLMTVLTQMVSIPSETEKVGAIEIGTFTGYSALCIAKGLAKNRTLIACDVSEEWTAIGKKHWELAGLSKKIDLKLGAATETVKTLGHLKGTLDLAFIDADKANYDAYYEACLELLRPGGIVLIDNIFWGGDVADLSITDPDTSAIRAIAKKVAVDPRVDCSLIPVADGVFMARKR